ncbi:Ulp1 protease family, C-terminal catalytic domain containing protein [Trema orientale]|uniref:Ulp1 protease family, C-terminal catalytic domain containing protein n=1 Tax=Trema orientale TaxID=63057 RepID=A0A2P5F2Z4_TREOI|nr:Ulp1 protease family, C-terminal catalytic domain containing protein [Trema orientale]
MSDFRGLELINWIGHSNEEVLKLKTKLDLISESVSCIRELESSRQEDEHLFNNVILEALNSRLGKEKQVVGLSKIMGEDNIENKPGKGYVKVAIDNFENGHCCDTKEEDPRHGLSVEHGINDFEDDKDMIELDWNENISQDGSLENSKNVWESIIDDDHSNIDRDVDNYGIRSLMEDKLELALNAISEGLKVEISNMASNHPRDVEQLNDISPDEMDILDRDEEHYGVFIPEGVELSTSRVIKIICDSTCKDENGNASPIILLLKNVRLKRLIQCILDSNKEYSEILFASDLVIVRRSQLMSLMPKELLDNRIINCIAHLLTMFERRRSCKKSKFWWIPTNISRPYPDLIDQYTDRSQWEDWVGPLSECEKNHWFIALVKLKEKEVHIYDSLEIPEWRNGIIIVDDILRGLDHAFKDEISISMPGGWSFTSFVVLKADNIPLRCTDNDCGIYVIRCMQAAYNNDEICLHGSAEEEREFVGLQVVTSHLNRRLSYIMSMTIE